MAVSSIVAALGSGSGIDTTALVTSLVDAQFAAKAGQLTRRDEALTAQISGAGSLKSAIAGFSTALNSLVRGGTLTTSPTSSNAGVARLATATGRTVSGLSGTLDVVQLARPQTAASAVIADRGAAIGTGSFTLTFGAATVEGGAMTDFTAGGGAPVTIAIGSGRDSLDGIAAAINAAGAGVTASVIGDGGGARLVLKGATGASQGFTLTSDDPGLAALSIGPDASATTIGSVAQDAIVRLDGIEVRRASNTIANLVDGLRVELTGPGTTTLGMSAPTAALSQAVGDFVETYNQLLGVVQQQTDAKTGALRGDPAALTLARSLARLPATVLSNGTGPRTLAELGVATNRNGTLRLDTARLAFTLAQQPQAVEAMFRDGSGASGGGLAAALGTIATAAGNVSTGLGASESRYTKAKSDLALTREKAGAAAEQVRTRLTAQFVAMDARVAAYKATQTFMENQVKAWNKSS